MFEKYLKDVFEVYKTGDAREESYYSSLERLFLAYLQANIRSSTHITVLPKKTEAGNPDFRIWDGRQHITGYIEAKRPGVNLDPVEDTEQLKRYLSTFPNLVLTNFFEFRLYRSGQRIAATQIGRPFIAQKLKTLPPVEHEKEFMELLQKFFGFSLPRAYTAKSLAVELARRTRFLKDEVISEELKAEEGRGQGFLLGFYEAFREHLLAGLTHDDFADLYAQTVTYGLFAARTRTADDFSRRAAFDNIPHTIGILRDVFRYISLEDLPAQLEWIVDDICDVLAVADINNILDRYFNEHNGLDPVVHFYETFLSEYGPEERERRGVYYTPEPVVSYICRSIHHLLKSIFKRPDGLASDTVRLLDPAAGTLTFPAIATRIAVEEASKKYGKGSITTLIREHILRNFYAFELMMAPYAVGHLKIGFLLKELGYNLSGDERFKLYLTNTLEMKELAQSNLPGMASLARESHYAGEVKRSTPILVILGNPPYSGHSSNVGDWISKEIREYYQVDAKPLGERNPKWLQDDYVKFVRFAQWKIDQTGEGILGFITNHSYLDNPTFRGMRQSLMRSFDQIYLLNLHGNSLKKEASPDGSKDENVFDIRQGVAIGIFVKKTGVEKKVVHADLWGLRERKYAWLVEHDMRTTDWQTIKPKSEFYFFVRRDETLLDRYQSWPKLTEIFPVNSVGIVTARDKFAIDIDRQVLERRIRMFRDKNVPDEMIRQTFGLSDNRDWKMEEKRPRIVKDENWKEKITKILYRPFDIRWIFYHSEAIDFGRQEVMRHMTKENLGLSTTRSIEIGRGFEHVLLTNMLITHHTVSLKEVNYLFPLYLYPETRSPKREALTSTLMLFDGPGDYTTKKPNIAPHLLQELAGCFKKSPSPEDILFYIYAVLYSPVHREKYAEFLKSDLPRVPFTSDARLFERMAGMGKDLADLHLMRSAALDAPTVRFEGSGENRIEKTRYDDGKCRVYINEDQYFEGVSEDVWNYHIGGYQVLDKWLKDRKKHRLTFDEIRHYCRIATALAKTIQIQTKLDELYPRLEKSTFIPWSAHQ